MFCIDPAPRPVTLVANEPATVLELGREDLILMRQQAPRAAASLVSVVFHDVLRRLRSVDERINRELRADRLASETTKAARSSHADSPISHDPRLSRLRGSA